jgi:hypothetical protein
VTTRGKTAGGIEVRLGQPNLEVTCRILFRDGSAIAVGISSLFIAGAQREITAWLMELGYKPAGQWRTDTGREAARAFRHPGRQVSAALLPAPRPATPAAPQREPEPGPSGEPAPRKAPRPRPAATRNANGRPALSSGTAEEELRTWARAYLRRDEVIRAADAAGISVQRITEVTGIARTTILRILGSPPARRGQDPVDR